MSDSKIKRKAYKRVDVAKIANEISPEDLQAALDLQKTNEEIPKPLKKVDVEALISFGEAEIDEILKEDTTPAWYRIDLGVKYQLDNLLLRLEFENITNQLFYRHLSYSRNPFATGTKVYEPGRRVYMSLSYSI